MITQVPVDDERLALCLHASNVVSHVTSGALIQLDSNVINECLIVFNRIVFGSLCVYMCMCSSFSLSSN